MSRPRSFGDRASGGGHPGGQCLRWDIHARVCRRRLPAGGGAPAGTAEAAAKGCRSRTHQATPAATRAVTAATTSGGIENADRHNDEKDHHGDNGSGIAGEFDLANRRGGGWVAKLDICGSAAGVTALDGDHAVADLSRGTAPEGSSSPRVSWRRGSGRMLVQDFEAGVDGAASPETLWRLFAAFFRGTVVQRVATAHLPPGVPDQQPAAYARRGLFPKTPSPAPRSPGGLRPARAAPAGRRPAAGGSLRLPPSRTDRARPVAPARRAAAVRLRRGLQGSWAFLPGSNRIRRLSRPDRPGPSGWPPAPRKKHGRARYHSLLSNSSTWNNISGLRV